MYFYMCATCSGAPTSNVITTPGWSDYVKTTFAEAHPGAPRMDEKAFEDAAPQQEDKFSTSFQKMFK